MNTNKKIGFVLACVILLGLSFYGGMVYGKSQSKTLAAGTFSPGTRGLGGRNGNAFAGGFTNGQIISKDATSITVSLASGGSKIIFLDTNTKISKQVNGTLSDLTVGTQVSATGTPNTDGSISANSVQIRPAMPVRTTNP